MPVRLIFHVISIRENVMHNGDNDSRKQNDCNA